MPLIASGVEDWEVVGNTWRVASDSSPGMTYEVTVRRDTRKGGTYLHCDCGSWPRMVSKGGCKHVVRVMGKRVGAASLVPAYTCADCNVRWSTLTDLNLHAERVHAVVHTPEDLSAAARILAWVPQETR